MNFSLTFSCSNEYTINYQDSREQKLKAEQGISQIFNDSPEKLCIVRVFSVLDWDVADFTLGGGIKKLILPDSDFTWLIVDMSDLGSDLTSTLLIDVALNRL